MTNTPRYCVTRRPSGAWSVRYWMADDTSILICDYADRADAEAHAEASNAHQVARDARAAAMDARLDAERAASDRAQGINCGEYAA